jgi:hypothetical protein
VTAFPQLLLALVALIPYARLELPEQSDVPSVTLSGPAYVALPEGWLPEGATPHLREQGSGIESQHHVRSRWPDKSAKHVHLYAPFKWANGKPLNYVILPVNPFPRIPLVPSPKIESRAPSLDSFMLDDLGREYWAFNVTRETLDSGPVAVVEYTRAELRRGQPDQEPMMDVHSWATTYADRVDVQHCFTIAQDLRGVRISELSVSGKLPGSDWIAFLRDDGKRKPFRVEQTGDRFKVSLWPNGGTKPEPVTEANFHKLDWLHTGQYLDFHQTAPYEFAKELAQRLPGEWTESHPFHLRTSSPQGLSLVIEFSLAKAADKAQTDGMKRLLQNRPIARTSAEWTCDSGAFGPIAPRSKKYATFEDSVEKALLGFFDQGKLGHDGAFTYGSAPERMVQVAGSTQLRPHSHRMASALHYPLHGLWLSILRSDPSSPNYQALLDTARRESNYLGAFGQCRSAPPAGTISPFKGLVPFGFNHAISLLQWGKTGHWLPQSDTECSVTGHWPDPYTLQLKWLYDCDWFAKQGYDGWTQAVVGTAEDSEGREANCTLAQLVYAWRYTGDQRHLLQARGLAKTLTVRPLAQQVADKDLLGPLWYPTWPMLADEVLGTPASKQFIIEGGRALAAMESPWHVEGISTLAVIARAAELSERKLADKVWPPKPLVKHPLFEHGPGPLGERNESIALPVALKSLGE